MKTSRIEYLKSDWSSDVKRFQICENILDKLGDKLSDEVNFSPTVYIIIGVNNRDDLQALMTLAPLWRKEPLESGLRYVAFVDGEEIKLDVTGAGLPETCKMVEEEYEIPAQPAKEARTATRMVVKCPKPAEATP